MEIAHVGDRERFALKIYKFSNFNKADLTNSSTHSILVIGIGKLNVKMFFFSFSFSTLSMTFFFANESILQNVMHLRIMQYVVAYRFRPFSQNHENSKRH